MSRDTYVRGIDISHHQSEIDWRAVPTSNIVFAFTKATQGTGFVDKRVHINWPEIKKNGLLLGAYHFLNPGEDPVRQAEHFLNTIDKFSRQYGGLDLPAVLDVETRGSTPIATLVGNCKKWLDTVENALGHVPIIYTRYYFWKDHMTENGKTPAWGNRRYPMWTAHYTSAPKPLVPVGWDDHWDFWQFTETGQVNGIGGGVDIDYFNGDAAGLKAWLEKAMGRPVEITTDKPKEEERTTTGPGDMLPVGAVGRWPLEMDGYQEYFYERSPERPMVSAADVYGKPVRAKLTSRTQDVAIAYKPPLRQSGRYRVEAFVPEQNSHTTRAMYHVNTYEAGQRVEKTVIINQSQFKDQWVPLGDYDIDPTRPRDGQVNVTDYTTEDPPRMIAFAGVRWRPV